MARRVGILAVGITLCAACEVGDPDPGCDPRCERNDLMTCDAEGAAVRTPCGDQRCAADSPVPQCVPAAALPCEPGADTPPACENGRVLVCDAEAAYLLASPCEPGAVCAGETATCREAAAIPCGADWNPVCVAGERFICVGGRVAVERASCE
jgi:hypothetical protein